MDDDIRGFYSFFPEQQAEPVGLLPDNVFAHVAAFDFHFTSSKCLHSNGIRSAPQYFFLEQSSQFDTYLLLGDMFGAVLALAFVREDVEVPS